MAVWEAGDVMTCERCFITWLMRKPWTLKRLSIIGREWERCVVKFTDDHGGVLEYNG